MKKKKQTLYIRKNRINYNKKKTIKLFEAEMFFEKFKKHFRKKISITKKKNFVKFLNKFQSTNFHKSYTFIKYFGMNKSYKLINFYYKSKKSKKLLNKFKIKNNKKKIINKIKEIKVLKLKFMKMFYQQVKFKRIKSLNVSFKKKLCLYFSYRHLMYLPVRGQRTRTNAKTRKDFFII